MDICLLTTFPSEKEFGVSKSIENAQKKVEQRNFGIRKHLLEYDDVMNQQRQVVYNIRKQALNDDDISDVIDDMINDFVDDELEKFNDTNVYEVMIENGNTFYASECQLERL